MKVSMAKRTGLAEPIERVEPSETDRAYLAGLVESLARLAFKRERDASGEVVRRRLDLVFCGLREAQCRWLLARYPKSARVDYGPLREVRYVTNEAATIFVDAHPHLLAMKPEAKLVFAFAETMIRCGRDLSPEAKAKRVEIEREVARLSRC